MQILKRIIIPIFFVSLLSACSTANKEEDFYAIQVGSSKGQVLASLGSPKTSYQRNGLDYWTYEIKRPDQPEVIKKIIIFRKDNVIQINHGIPTGQPKDSDYKEL